MMDSKPPALNPDADIRTRAEIRRAFDNWYEAERNGELEEWESHVTPSARAEVATEYIFAVSR